MLTDAIQLQLPSGSNLLLAQDRKYERHAEFVGFYRLSSGGPSVSTGMVNYSNQHGAARGGSNKGARSRTFEVTVFGPRNTRQGRINYFDRIGECMSQEGVLIYTDAMNNTRRFRFIYDGRTDIEDGPGPKATFSFTITSADPFEYSDIVWEIPTGDGNLITPGSTFRAWNEGSSLAYPTFFVYGPCDGFTLSTSRKQPNGSYVLTGDSLHVDRVLESGDYVEVVGARVSHDRGVFLNGTHRTPLPVDQRTYPVIHPGNNTGIQFTASNPGSGCGAYMQWRSCWE